MSKVPYVVSRVIQKSDFSSLLLCMCASVLSCRLFAVSWMFRVFRSLCLRFASLSGWSISVMTWFIKNRSDFNHLWKFLLGPFPSCPPSLFGSMLSYSLEYLFSYKCFNSAFQHCMRAPFFSIYVLRTWRIVGTQKICLWKKFSSVQSLSHAQLFAAPWTAARKASLFINNSWSLLRLMSIESVMPSNHLILCCPLLFLPSIFPSIRVFSNESVLLMGWPKFQLQHQSFQWICGTDFL